MSGFTRSSRVSSLKTFSAFLEWNAAERQTNITELREITFELLGDFTRWLIEERKLSERSAQATFRGVARHLIGARRLHPQEFQSDFEIPSSGFHNINRNHDSDRLPPDVFAEIIRAAELNAKAIQDNYNLGDFPTCGLELIPFMILIAANTAMNAFSLYALRRDCLEPHPIDEHGVYLTWKKARCSTGIQRQLHWKRTSQTIALIQFLLEYTKPLIERADVPFQEFLFLYESSMRHHPPRVNAMCYWNTHVYSLAQFRAVNGLPHFSFGQMRSSAATHNHLKNGGNLRKTQMLLGHKSIETTEVYINNKTVTPLYNQSIRGAQEAMVNRITVIPKPASEAISELVPNLSASRRNSILRGEFSTGICRCKNPLDSPQRGQRKGHMCTLFLACLSCPNAIFFLEDLPGVIALADHLISLKNSMAKDTWEALYSNHVRILNEEIILAFSEQEIANAKLKSSTVTDMHLLVNKNTPR
jgi:integrase